MFRTYLYNGRGQRVNKSASIGAAQCANVRHFLYAKDPLTSITVVNNNFAASRLGTSQ
jgi:hypothetical protein